MATKKVNIFEVGRPKSPRKKREEKAAKKFVAVKNPMPFDLEEARNGTPLQLRDGTPCKFIGFSPDVKEGLVIAYPDSDYAAKNRPWRINNWYPNGLASLDRQSNDDVCLSIEGKEQWVNLYKSTDKSNFVTGDLFDSKELAEFAVGAFQDLLVPPFRIFVRK